jgi:hypothetical protein
VPDDLILSLVKQHFDLRPAAIIRDLNLRRPLYRQVAAYGHFGRDDLDVPWERLDKVAAIQADLSVLEGRDRRRAPRPRPTFWPSYEERGLTRQSCQPAHEHGWRASDSRPLSYEERGWGEVAGDRFTSMIPDLSLRHDARPCRSSRSARRVRRGRRCAAAGGARRDCGGGAGGDPLRGAGAAHLRRCTEQGRAALRLGAARPDHGRHGAVEHRLRV